MITSRWLSSFTFIPLAAALAACGGAQQAPSNATTTVLSLANLDCASCGDELATGLAKEPGVYSATFDKRRSEVKLVSDPGFDALAKAQKLKGKEEYELVLGGGKGSYLAWAKPAEGADVAQIAKDGEDVPDLAPHLVKGKVTIVDFSAIWCDPCREMDAHVLKLAAARQDVAYRKLEIGDWDTPLAQRWMKGVKELPYVLVYDKQGQRVDAISGLDLKRLDAAVDKASK